MLSLERGALRLSLEPLVLVDANDEFGRLDASASYWQVMDRWVLENRDADTECQIQIAQVQCG